jgi:sugar fermentation stimulation protein A
LSSRAGRQKPFRFPEPLEEGVVVSRPNRFIMMVKAGGETIRCHCPTTGRLGDAIMADVPCLFSRSRVETRKTRATVEAISLQSPGTKARSWIGINQTAANRYIEHFFRTGQLARMATGSVSREVSLGKSRIDFLVGRTYVEVKTPLTTLPMATGTTKASHGRFASFDRLIKHMDELGSALESERRAVIALCYLYDAAPFVRPPRDKHNALIVRAAERAKRRGVERWQVNLSLDKRRVKLLRYFRND